MLKTILDVAVIAILVIAFISGYVKGFYKSIWGILTFAVFAGTLFFTTAPISKIVIKSTPIDEKIAAAIEAPIGKLKGMSEEFVFTDEQTVSADLAAAGVSQSFIKNYVKLISKHAEPGDKVTFKYIVAQELSQTLTTAAVGIALSIVYGILLYGILFRLLKKLFDKVVKSALMKPADKVLGIVFQTVFAAAILIIIGGVAGTMSHAKFMKKVNEAYPTTMAFKYIYGENPLQSVFDSKLNVGKFIK